MPVMLSKTATKGEIRIHWTNSAVPTAIMVTMLKYRSDALAEVTIAS
jgi:hypothetical protein